jgi:hypothetical protein
MSFNPCFKDLTKVLAPVANERIRYEDVIDVVGVDGQVTRFARRAVPAGDGVALTLRDLGVVSADQKAMPS